MASDLRTKEMSDTATTSISRRLKAPRQKEPLWRTSPYTITLSVISTVKTEVHKIRNAHPNFLN